MRVLFWLAVIILVVFAVRNKLRSVKGKMPNRNQTNTANSANEASEAKSGEAMLRCVHCSMYIPASEAVRDADVVFCSDQHRRLHSESPQSPKSPHD